MYRQSEKNLLSSNICSTCPHNMVNFGPLAAEIVSLVWGTPRNFNGFRVLAALLHGTLAVGVSQTAALNRGRHLYSAGRPSRWALAHILVCKNLRLKCFKRLRAQKLTTRTVLLAWRALSFCFRTSRSLPLTVFFWRIRVERYSCCSYA